MVEQRPGSDISETSPAADPGPMSAGARLFVAWLVGVLAMLVYVAIPLADRCYPFPGLGCLAEMALGAAAAAFWPIYWPIQITLWVAM